MPKDIVDVAIGEIGYSETGNNRTKYGAWYGMNGAAWCHMFVSWCANQAGVSTSVVPKTASTSSGMEWFKNKGLFKVKGSYIPKRGDMVYFKTGRNHVGIVEKVSGTTLYTVEGNTPRKVARRTYLLSEKTITGYGVPKYTNLNSPSNTGGSSGSSQASAPKKASETEIVYLKKVLEKKKPVSTTIKGTAKATNKLPEGNVQVIIQNGKKRFFLPVKDGLTITWERKGTPGKLNFETKYDKKYKFVEGNPVSVIVDGTNFFYGFIFTRNLSKDGIMSVTAYDQLRYLKAKDTLIYKNKSADQVIKIIADRFKLPYGKLADTKYKMSAVEDDATLFDMIQNTLDNTLMIKNKIYIFYDKIGKLRLTDVADMKLNDCLIDSETGEDYTYQTSIDDNVYNQIKLIYENSENRSFDLYVAKDTKSMNQWGVLQYLEKIDTPDIGALKSNAYLKLYDQKQRNLSIDGVIGNKKVRAGSLLPIVLDVIDTKIANYMLVEKVTHTFDNKRHTMNLVVSGGGFSG